MNHLSITDDKRQKGIGKMDDEGPVAFFEVVPFDAVFDREWTSDLHFVTYALQDAEGKVEEDPHPRLRKSVLSEITRCGGDIVVGALVLDFDLQDMPGGEFPLDDDGKPCWTAEELRGFTSALPSVCEALAEKNIARPLVYTTKHGARFVHRLLRPVSCSISEDLTRGLLKVYDDIGIPCDPACADWTRLFRAPKVVRGGVRQSGERWFFIAHGEGTTDADAIDPVTKAAAYKDRYENIRPVTADQPTPEQAAARLFETGAKGQQKQTPMRKAAELVLRTTASYDVIFGDKPIADEGGRDNALIKLVGSATNWLLGPTGKQSGYAFEPEDIFALFLGAVDDLEPDAGTPDWSASLWTKVKSVYEKERAKVVEEEVASEILGEEQQHQLLMMLERVRATCDLPILHSDDEVEALSAFSHMLLLCDPAGKFRAIMPDGSVSRMAVGATRIYPLIRACGLDSVIDTTKPGARGALLPKSEQEIIREYSVDVAAVEGATGIDASELHGENLQDLRVVEALYRRNPKLDPAYNTEVAEWLELLTDEPTLLKRWLAYSLDFEGGPICALSLAGAPGAGKGLLAQGLVETLERPVRADKTALVGDFNASLADSPWLIVDEGLPRNTAHDVADTFRALTAGEPLSVNEKYKSVRRVRNPMRIMFTANNLDVVEQLASHRVNDAQDQAALSLRIMHIDVPQAAERHLRARGGLTHTKGWVQGANGSPSNFTLAKHLLWLYEHRADFGAPDQRFLVEGRPDHSVVQTLRVAGKVPQAISRAILTALEHGVIPAVVQGLSVQEGRLCVTARAIEEQHRQLNESNVHLNAVTVGRALRNMVSPTSPADGAKVTTRTTVSGDRIKQRWWDIDVKLMWGYAQDAGYSREKLKGLMVEQFGYDPEED